MRVLLIDNYDSYTHNVAHLLGSLTGAWPHIVKNDALSLAEVLALAPDAIVLSPGPGHPQTARDVGIGPALLDAFVDTPILGLCLGHQLIAVHFGGRVARVLEPRHGSTTVIAHDGSGLFGGLPQGFSAMRYHSLTVCEPLPDVLRVTATGGGEVMALCHRSRPLYGVQFHPESIMSEHGLLLLGNFLGRPAREHAPARTERAVPARAVEVALPVDAPADALALAQTFVADETTFLLHANDAASTARRYSFMGSGQPRAFASWPALARALAERRSEPKGEAAAVPFGGGLVGALPYAPELGPDCPMHLIAADSVLAIDHTTGRVLALGVGADVAEATAQAETLRRRVHARSPLPTALPEAESHGAFLLSEADYRDKIARACELIRAGEAYELCLTHRWHGHTTATPWALYRRLCALNPSPYAAFLRFPELALLSASPERLLRVSVDGVAETRPIKGTRRRGATASEDAALARELETSDKDRRENLMIVDVSRHDLGGVCALGGVSVPELLRVETHPTLLQLVSTVRGVLADGVDASAVAQALSPPASMTGAPKARAVEWLRTLEPEPRGYYAGALGYFGYRGNADLAVTIRTIVCAGPAGRDVRFGVGGAIVLGSDPADEWRETLLKARALLQALGCAA